ncbi:uncharacterized protein LOC144701501 [Wolffia australiana]
MDLIFETAEGRVFTLEVWFFATVLEMKEAIQKRHGFPVPRQHLIFQGKLLEDDRNTEFYGLLHGSRLRLFLELPPEFRQDEPVSVAQSPGQPMQRLRIMVQPKFGRKIAMEVNALENVREIRKELTKLQDKQKVILPADGYFFIFRQNVMDEDLSFQCHDVRHGDTIEIFSGTVIIGTRDKI